MTTNDKKNKTPNLTPRQRSALPILAASPTVAEAARQSDLSATTLHRWLEDADFRNELNRLREEASELAKAELQTLMLAAVRALGDALQDPNPDVRMRAIRTALSYGVKLTEINKLRDEIHALEDALPLWAAHHTQR